MGFFSYFDVRRKVRELEDALVMVVEEQDNMRDSIRGVQQSVGGLKGAVSRWSSSPYPYEEDPDAQPPDDTPDEMSVADFTKKHGLSPKEMASLKIHSGVWK